MKYPCELIQDLLPLYHDNVCSPPSRKMVEEHLSDCEACRSLVQKMDPNAMDDSLQSEREHVVQNYNNQVKRKSLLVGVCLASVLLVPVLVCLICNLATGHALDWFFIVLSACLVLASVTVVPLIAETKKGLWALNAFTPSLLLLLLSCCLYSGGSWFFVTAFSVLLALSLLFLPYVLSQLPLQGFAARNKALLCLAADSVLLWAVLVSIGLLAGNPGYWLPTLLIAGCCLLFVWALFFVLRTLKASGRLKSKSDRAAFCLASAVSAALFVCLVCNLAVGHSLDWFFIVLSALLVFASVTVLPLAVKQNRLPWMAAGFTGSLLLLLLVCCLYSGGSWFWMAGISVLFGLSLPLLPPVLYRLPLRGFAARHKGLLCMAADSALLYALLTVAGLYNNSIDYWKTALLSATVFLLFGWVLFFLIRYWKVNALIKAGLCTILSGVFLPQSNLIVHWILGDPNRYDSSPWKADLLRWDFATTSSNVTLLILLSCLVVGGLLLACGLVFRKKLDAAPPKQG